MKTFVAAIMLVFVPALAHASDWRVEAAAGGCRYTAAGDGIWWNSKYPHDVDMTSGCGMVSISRIVGNKGWRLAYIDLGAARSDAVFPMVDSEQALPPFDGSHCNKSTYSGCLGRGVGVQRARGLSLGYVVEHGFGKAMLGLEGGAFVYSGSWDVHITSEAGTMDFHWQGLQATPYVGFTMRYEYLFSTIRAYGSIKANEHDCGGCSGVTGGPASQALIGVSVPF